MVGALFSRDGGHMGGVAEAWTTTKMTGKGRRRVRSPPGSQQGRNAPASVDSLPLVGPWASR